jgi:hypothetical protein
MRSKTLLRSTVGRRTALILASGIAPAIIHNAAYANTLTALVPDMYAALDVVSRELVGFLPGANRSATTERAAVGQNVKYPIAPTQTASDIVPSMTVPEPQDNTIGTAFMAITKARAVDIGFTGEEQRFLNTGGVGYLSTVGMLFAQAMRTLTNEVEADLAAEAAAKASRAYGTAGTTPFASDSLAEAAQVRKILDDNGAPLYGRSLVLNTSAGAAMRTVKNLSRVNEAGSQMTLRQGELLDVFGFSVKETGQAVRNIAGTGAAATTNAAGYAAGATVITLAGAGTGTILPGNAITFAGDTNKYIVVPNGGDADVSNGGTITIAKPGLRVAIPAAATAITVGATYAANVAFSADALHVALRPPAVPQEGDLALDRMLITDPRSGISFEVSIYPGYRKIRIEVALAWGVHGSKSEHIAILLG